MNIEQLPVEIRRLITANLPLYDIINLCQTSKGFEQVCSSNMFWKIMLTRDFKQEAQRMM